MWARLKEALGIGRDPEVQAAKVRMRVDQQDPRKRFIQCILEISQDADPAYRPGFGPMAVRQWYGIESAQKLNDRIERYISGAGSTPGYDAFRAAFLARAGLPAGLIDEFDSWTKALHAALKVQRSYPGWEHFGHGYLEGHVTYRRSQGDSADRLAEIRRGVLARIASLNKGSWAAAPFNTPLF